MDVQGRTAELLKQRAAIEGAPDKMSAARKRMQLLFDEGTFVETGAFVKQRPTELNGVDAEAEGVVTGYGAVNGMLVFAFSQDVSVLKGSISEMNSKKICDIAAMALKAKAPIVSMLDSCGIRLHEGVDALSGYGRILSAFNEVSGECAHASIVFGTASGPLSFLSGMADYSVIVNGAELFMSSPDVIKARFNDKEAGTAEKAFANGTVSEICENDEAAVAAVKVFLATMCDVPVTADDANRLVPEIETILSADTYDVKSVIAAIADDGRMLEFYKGFAKNIVTGVINLDCMTVGVVANQNCENGGALTSDAAKKAAKFISLCEDFGLPVLTLVDTDGFVPDANENIEDASALSLTYINASIPKITLIMGKAYGSGYISMCSKETGADLVYAYPTAEVAALPAETGAVFMCAQELVQTSGDPIKERDALIEKYRTTIASVYESAKRGYVDDIIEICTTRQLLISGFDMLADKE